VEKMETKTKGRIRTAIYVGIMGTALAASVPVANLVGHLIEQYNNAYKNQHESQQETYSPARLVENPVVTEAFKGNYRLEEHTGPISGTTIRKKEFLEPTTLYDRVSSARVEKACDIDEFLVVRDLKPGEKPYAVVQMNGKEEHKVVMHLDEVARIPTYERGMDGFFIR
jgi:hypothetical protein